MEFFKKFDFKSGSLLKTIGIILAIIVIFSFVIRLLGSSINSAFNNNKSEIAYQDDSLSVTKGYGESGVSYDQSVGLSIRNIVPAPTTPTAGNDAEDFEVTEYNATIETNRLDDTCAQIDDLKAKDYVIFESATKYDTGCNYAFKVQKDSVEEILSIVKNFDPKELSESVFTIKKLINDFTSEEEILKNKRDSIDETLKNAVEAYDKIAALALQTKDAESLAKIIDSKINIVERLTQERINVNSQLETLERAKADQLDRLEYTYFNLNVYENKFINGENIKDSWQRAIKEFVNDVNQAIQGITVNLAGFIFLAIQYIVYLFILLIVAKYGWQLIKYIWKK
jgi:hypothetical protein